jgi:acyl dehydratase
MTAASLPADVSPGDRFATPGRTVTESDVVGFAALTGDWHPQHADAVWAAASPFGERIAHGMLVLSFAVGLVPLDPERVIALRRVRDATFKRPVRLGDTIRVEGRVEEVKPVDDATSVVALAWSVINQDGKTVTRAVVEVVWRTSEVPVASNGAADEPIAGVLPL